MAHCEAQGQRSSMEDALCVRAFEESVLLAVCDGHGGDEVARLAVQRLADRSDGMCTAAITETVFSNMD